MKRPRQPSSNLSSKPGLSRRHVFASAVAATPLFAGISQADAPRAKKDRKLLFAKGDKIIMIGDSVTDADHKDPGEGLFEAIGHGYVAMVDALLGAFHPELALRIVNKGHSGNTTRDLLARWNKDVIERKPTWVSVMIGINDVWRQYDEPTMPEAAVPIDEYERNLETLIEQTKPVVKGLILMTPYYIEPQKADRMRVTMDRYGAVVKRLAQKHGAVFVDTQAAFDAILVYDYSAFFGWDRIHPNHVGVAVLARAFLDAVGFSWGRA